MPTGSVWHSGTPTGPNDEDSACNSGGGVWSDRSLPCMPTSAAPFTGLGARDEAQPRSRRRRRPTPLEELQEARGRPVPAPLPATVAVEQVEDASGRPIPLRILLPKN